MLTPVDTSDAKPLPRTQKIRKPGKNTRLQPPSGLQNGPWEGWEPAWRGHGRTPHALQERHSPTAPVALRAPGGRQAQHSQRRIVDARLWDVMTPAQQDAALEIALVFETVSRGIGFASSDWTRTPSMRGAVNAAEIHGRLLSGYTDWVGRCRKAKVSHSMIIDILVFGFSCQALDRDRRARAGWTRRNLLKGLALYCEAKGWPS